ncbi:manganese efflux pump [Halanaerobacter jeridensis]|uniref:Mn2+ efflux pump MntP n=1 Tax=Halanaerobacter jeridensis TaxID=706427 RepID=A0A938XPD8_9FIRM|nr:manganese efflux pump [Halanaerobacter jeridensis]MBM7556452.1 putative Mn2+ efflux pump MntP [Halanaerobacter jeridensis]
MLNIIFIALALALDAFAVALGVGCGTQMKLREKSGIVISFAFFQFLFALLGAGLGNYIDKNIFNITGYISGTMILLIGMLLLWEGYKDDEACMYANLEFWTYIVLGISVSIDALGVGFSALYNFDLSLIFGNTLIIGLITAILTGTSFIVVKYIKNFLIVEKYADYIGGVVLIIFGLKMII